VIGVVDYGAGNLRNVQAALHRLGAPWRTVAGPGDLGGLGGLILPGVGRFAAASRRLRQAGLLAPLREFALSGRPFLGICLGMQLLFEGSDEDPQEAGLDVLRGRVRTLTADPLPHIGWALVEPRSARGVDPAGSTPPAAEEAPAGAGSILAGLPERFYAYFAHSFAAPADAPDAVALTDCPPAFASVARAGAAWGVQFHPEKSGRDGQAILANFVAAARGGDDGGRAASR
jgi:glutamine amidotransferase